MTVNNCECKMYKCHHTVHLHIGVTAYMTAKLDVSYAAILLKQEGVAHSRILWVWVENRLAIWKILSLSSTLTHVHIKKQRASKTFNKTFPKC